MKAPLKLPGLSALWTKVVKTWRWVSNLHIEETTNELKRLQKQLINQYVFLATLILISDAIRDYHYGLYRNAIILSTLSLVFFLILRFTRLAFSPRFIHFACLLLALVIFYFSSMTGTKSTISMYNFALLSAVTFLFNRNQLYYITSVYLTVFLLFLFNYFTDFSLFFDGRYNEESLAHNTFFLTFIHTGIIIGLSGWYLSKKNHLLLLLYKSKLRKRLIIDRLKSQVENNNLPKEIESLVELAKVDDIAFVPKFNTIFPDFQKKLLEIHPGMTPSEFKFCALLRLKFSTKDIALYNYVSIRTAQTRKNRLRKNLKLPSNVDLYHWMENL